MPCCPQCSSQVTPEAQFCSQCGQDLRKQAVRQVIGVTPEVKRAFPLSNTIAACTGAYLMLISMVTPWYRIRGSEPWNFIGTDLISRPGTFDLSWVRSAVPLGLMLGFASIVLFSVVYSLWSGVATRALWVLLGALSVLCVVGNAIYIASFDWRWFDGPASWSWNIVHAGSVLALIGALLVMLSGLIRMRGARG